uniref:Uncharacterized protein n=1 Tax=Romanomermis culicivorax TaxID=13658 RepID=A0A915KW91_ROMCU
MLKVQLSRRIPIGQSYWKSLGKFFNFSKKVIRADQVDPELIHIYCIG